MFTQHCNLSGLLREPLAVVLCLPFDSSWLCLRLHAGSSSDSRVVYSGYEEILNTDATTPGGRRLNS